MFDAGSISARLRLSLNTEAVHNRSAKRPNVSTSNSKPRRRSAPLRRNSDSRSAWSMVIGEEPAGPWITCRGPSTEMSKVMPARSFCSVSPVEIRVLGSFANGYSRDIPRSPADAFWLRMLGKRFSQDSTVIGKGSVPISVLAETIAGGGLGQPAILLYFPLEDYCAAVLRTPGHQSWVERVTHDIALNRDPLIGDIGGLTAAEKAAALWYSMIKRFERLLARHPNMRSLDANQLFDRPAETIAAASDLLGAGVDAQCAEAVAKGPLLSSYSKNPNLPFDNSVRRQLSEEAKSLLADELLVARRWVEKRTADDDHVPEVFDRPLI